MLKQTAQSEPVLEIKGSFSIIIFDIQSPLEKESLKVLPRLFLLCIFTT